MRFICFILPCRQRRGAPGRSLRSTSNSSLACAQPPVHVRAFNDSEHSAAMCRIDPSLYHKNALSQTAPTLQGLQTAQCLCNILL